MPGYGLPATLPESEAVQWGRAEQMLAAARNYWISSASPDGRPHAMPVWGLYDDGRLLFSTGRASRKGRNLAQNPRVVVHLESGDDVVILEGVLEELRDAQELARFCDDYDAKYSVRPDPGDPENAVYVLLPRIAFTWREQDFLESAARWTFAQ